MLYHHYEGSHKFFDTSYYRNNTDFGYTVKAPNFGNGLNFGRGFQLTFVTKF